MDIYEHIGKQVRAERMRRSWTQEQLAEKAEVHLSFIGQLERGAKKPSLRTLKGLAEVFEIKVGDLLDEPSPTTAKPYPMERKFVDLVRGQPLKRQQVLYDTLRQLVRQAKRISAR